MDHFVLLPKAYEAEEARRIAEEKAYEAQHKAEEAHRLERELIEARRKVGNFPEFSKRTRPLYSQHLG